MLPNVLQCWALKNQMPLIPNMMAWTEFLGKSAWPGTWCSGLEYAGRQYEGGSDCPPRPREDCPVDASMDCMLGSAVIAQTTGPRLHLSLSPRKSLKKSTWTRLWECSSFVMLGRVESVPDQAVAVYVQLSASAGGVRDIFGASVAA